MNYTCWKWKRSQVLTEHLPAFSLACSGKGHPVGSLAPQRYHKQGYRDGSIRRSACCPNLVTCVESQIPLWKERSDVEGSQVVYTCTIAWASPHSHYTPAHPRTLTDNNKKKSKPQAHLLINLPALINKFLFTPSLSWLVDMCSFQWYFLRKDSTLVIGSLDKKLGIFFLYSEEVSDQRVLIS